MAKPGSLFGSFVFMLPKFKLSCIYIYVYIHIYRYIYKSHFFAYRPSHIDMAVLLNKKTKAFQLVLSRIGKVYMFEYVCTHA